MTVISVLCHVIPLEVVLSSDKMDLDMSYNLSLKVYNENAACNAINMNKLTVEVNSAVPR
jgi:hypothetical protein